MNVPRRSSRGGRNRKALLLGTTLLVLGGLASFGTSGPVAQDGAAGAPEVAGRAFPESWFYMDRQTGKRYRQSLAIEGKKMPALKVKDWLGKPADLEKLDGKIVVVDFWATWCRPCVLALPKNARLYDEYKSQEVLFIGVHDSRRGHEQIDYEIKKAGVTYPTAVDDDGVSAKAWRVAFWPTYAVIDHKGVVRAAGLKPTHVEDVIKALLAERDAAAGS